MKVQPNFSWQKYEGKPEDQQEQFQHQLQSEHTIVANSINATINDLSFWTRERMTSFTWVNMQPIFTFSQPTVSWTSGGTVNTIPFAIVGNFVVIDMLCCLSNGTASTSDTVKLPHLDVTTAANSVEIVRNGTNVVITTGGTDYSAFSGYVTLYYYKT